MANTKVTDTKKKAKFKITAEGFSSEYKHYVGDTLVQFSGGKYETDNAAVIDNLKTCRWCEAVR